MSIRSKVLRELEKRPRRLGELKSMLGNDKKVQRAVEELASSGRILCKKGAWFAARGGLADAAIPCKLVKLGENFAFAAQAEGPDIFIPGRGLAGAMPGDEVLVKLFDKPKVPGSLEGEVLAVTRPRATFVGVVAARAASCSFCRTSAPSCVCRSKKTPPAGCGPATRRRWSCWRGEATTPATGRRRRALWQR